MKVKVVFRCSEEVDGIYNCNSGFDLNLDYNALFPGEDSLQMVYSNLVLSEGSLIILGIKSNKDITTAVNQMEKHTQDLFMTKRYSDKTLNYILFFIGEIDENYDWESVSVSISEYGFNLAVYYITDESKIFGWNLNRKPDPYKEIAHLKSEVKKNNDEVKRLTNDLVEGLTQANSFDEFKKFMINRNPPNI
jgi:hypothetical protein